MAQFEKLDEYLIVNTNTKNGVESAKSLCNALILVDNLNKKCIEQGTFTRYKVLVKPDWEWIGWGEVEIKVEI
jgi:hypothetical protein